MAVLQAKAAAVAAPSPKMLSIILPVFNEGEQLQHYLLALQELRSADCEIIAVDGGSTDSSLALLQQYCDQVITSSQGRSIQMNTGAAAAQGEILLFLHADTLLPKHSKTLITQALENADWGRFDVKLDSHGAMYRVISTLMNWRSRLSKICTGDQALFFNKSFFLDLGGYPDTPLMEDIAICKTARSMGRFVALKNKVRTSARRWQKHGLWRTILLMWELRLRYFLGQSPSSLARRYYG